MINDRVLAEVGIDWWSHSVVALPDGTAIDSWGKHNWLTERRSEPMMKNESQSGCASGWHKGPLPADTWNWGGVVLVGSDPNVGFFFADFQGDHVLIQKSLDGLCVWVRIHPNEVAYFNNCLSMPVG